MGDLYCQDNARYRQFIGNSMNELIEQAQELKDAILDQTGIDAEVIAVGENILGVDGTYTSDADAVAGDIAPDKIAYVNGVKLVGVSTAVETGDADATALDIAAGKTAYINGVKITGVAGIAEYALTIDGTGGNGTGSVTVGGDAYVDPVNYKAGSEVELVATPDAGSVFVKWTVGGVDASEEATFTYTMPVQASTVVAVFNLEG